MIFKGFIKYSLSITVWLKSVKIRRNLPKARKYFYVHLVCNLLVVCYVNIYRKEMCLGQKFLKGI